MGPMVYRLDTYGFRRTSQHANLYILALLAFDISQHMLYTIVHMFRVMCLPVCTVSFTSGVCLFPWILYYVRMFQTLQSLSTYTSIYFVIYTRVYTHTRFFD